MSYTLDSFWPKSVPVSSKIANIEQIVYSLYHSETSDAGLIQIWANNILDDSTTAYFWRKLPRVYIDPIHRITFKLESLLSVLHPGNHKGPSPMEAAVIKKNIVYIDRVLDAIWEEAFDATENGDMKGSWRSVTFDEWLDIEWHVKRHNPEAVRLFLSDGGDKDFGGDPFTLGTCYFTIRYCIDILYYRLELFCQFRGSLVNRRFFPMVVQDSGAEIGTGTIPRLCCLLVQR